jgi:carbonic anhydrase/acetyltransferase-like protein (isoleucine patch superfamily)
MIYQLEDRKPVMKGDYYVAPNAAVIGSVVMEHNSSVWFNVTIRGDNDVITLGENVNVQDGSVIHTDGGVP